MISLTTYGSSGHTVRHGMPTDTLSTFSDDNFVVQPADVVFVSALQCNRVLLERTFCGASSIKELITVIGNAIGDSATGLVTLRFRNRDRGCSLHMAVRYRRCAPLFASA